ncbi:hypothetical protein HK103_006765 [Boothiomyces macroporosus]|uniref:Ankyrin repeat protein n=1 Tax=Boothiomyces macroporosus TaxID=261099 RepID=A0AAD5UDW7_9FUNG|nr:hypothetical protein HK103_006765 [Boothiomyces macroporosus]
MIDYPVEIILLILEHVCRSNPKQIRKIYQSNKNLQRLIDSFPYLWLLASNSTCDPQKPFIPPIIQACQRNDIEAILMFVKAGISLETRDSLGQTCIYKAIIGNHQKQLLYLLNKTNLNVADYAGRSPLRLATDLNRKEMVRLLLPHSDIESKTNDGRTCLFVCCEQSNTQLFDMLKHANNNVQINTGETPLFIAIQKQNYKLVQYLLKTNDIHHTIRNGWSILHTAVSTGNEQIVKMVLRRIGPNQADICGIHPIHLAAQKPNYNICKMLIEHGAEINCVSNSGMTPLFKACLSGSILIVRLLLQNGARIYPERLCERLRISFLPKALHVLKKA